MDEEKERPQYHSEAGYGAQQKEITHLSHKATEGEEEKLESEGLDPDEFDENEQPACAEAPADAEALADRSADREELADLL